ncbi:hypothetical protein SCHPADRAFT_995499 [Schizopora paradoxa]|uniref:Metal homeostatis protein bsd2 n=1 Tax=Schizopora paradoxa TaxID=27342 RepID=A0A0H2S230_9AGAM|nr:hypothetical protein SCHPADRAFT_995499 [Schizopora paradoxa]
MPAQYAALPSDPRHDDEIDELEAAFEGSDDEGDEDQFHDARSEYQPLKPEDTSSPEVPLTNAGIDGGDVERSTSNGRHARTQSTYDFENVNDYDYAYHPPPGEPPRADRALENNNWGNTNGIIPDFSNISFPQNAHQRGLNWIRSFLPERFRGRSSARERVVGGGFENDGVFANVMAKPTVHAPGQLEGDEVDGVYVMPEDAQKDAPPSYASAQADSVPPYWETTIHAPSSLSPGNMLPGELPIDGLATGTLFSFLWNMLVSISFQFVGFLLTYLMHTTHAAKLGARAGLGLTLVQYGFALRTNEEQSSEGMGMETNLAGTAPPAIPTFATAAEADSWFAANPNATALADSSIAGDPNTFMNDVTTEWLAFLLMTIGWFILLNSLLGFWRIKRWERSILASHQSPSTTSTSVSQSQTDAEPTTRVRHHRTTSSLSYPRNPMLPFLSPLERTLGIRVPSMGMFREGLGFNAGAYPGTDARPQSRLSSLFEGMDGVDGVDNEGHSRVPEEPDLEAGHPNSEHEQGADDDENTALFNNIPHDHPERARLIAEAYENERRLQEDLRAAGLL